MTQDISVGIDPQRTKTIAALYELARLLEQNPELPIPYQLEGRGYGHLSMMLFGGGDPRAELANIVRILPGPITKRVRDGDDQGPDYFDVDAVIGGVIKLTVTAYRDQVCERVVTGTREVVESIPDPSVEVPMVEVTKTVEDVEWVCAPLMREQVTS